MTLSQTRTTLGKATGLILVVALLLHLFLALLPPKAYAKADPIKLVVNGATIQPDAAPYISNGRTFVPIRFATEPLGAVAQWEGGAAQTATIIKDDVVITIKIGSKIATVNGNKVTLDAAAAVKNNRTFVPIRFISEALNATVDWSDTTKTITITALGEAGQPAQKPFQYLGYYYHGQPSLNDLTTFKQELTGVIHFGYYLKEDGTVSPKDNFSNDLFHAANGGYDTAKNAGVSPYMLVTGFSKSVLTAVLSDPVKRQKTIDEIAANISNRGLSGVDLDFESVDASQRENLVTFVKDLRQKLGSNQKITLSAMPRSAANQTWLDGYDYAGLAKHADSLILMCYNEHYSGGSPGAVASTSWVDKVIQYTLNQGVSKNKIVIALGSYGYDWPKDQKGSSLSNTAARSKAAEFGATIYRDEASGCLYYNYTATDGIAHQVWFEDSVSLGQKAALAKKYDLSGLAFWRLGFYTTEIWSSILTATNHPNAAAWQQKAKPEAPFPIGQGDNSDDSNDIENSDDFIPQS